MIFVRNVQLIMNKLLAHPGFRLIYVNDGHMSLITPLEHQEDILENGYRCISHLWGNVTRWENHSVKNVPWGVDVREEKRVKLLQIFNHYKGYWWMDVFCTDQESNNKPLSIMGDVYRNCKECICMMDIKMPDFISHHQHPKNYMKVVLDHILEIAECKWNKRVWTLQEWMLPPIICYTTERIEEVFFIIYPDSIIKTYFPDGRRSKFWWIYVMPKIRRIVSSFIMFTRKARMDGLMDNTNAIIAATLLMKSGRECKNPEDYYYGAASFIGISLTDGLSFLEVEEEFLLQYNKLSRTRMKRIEPIGTEGIYKLWRFEGMSRIINHFLG
jgi:hypothetical protein